MKSSIVFPENCNSALVNALLSAEHLPDRYRSLIEEIKPNYHGGQSGAIWRTPDRALILQSRLTGSMLIDLGGGVLDEEWCGGIPKSRMSDIAKGFGVSLYVNVDPGYPPFCVENDNKFESIVINADAGCFLALLRHAIPNTHFTLNQVDDYIMSNDEQRKFIQEQLIRCVAPRCLVFGVNSPIVTELSRDEEKWLKLYAPDKDAGCSGMILERKT